MTARILATITILTARVSEAETTASPTGRRHSRR